MRCAEARKPHRRCPVKRQKYEEANWRPLYPLVSEVAKFLVQLGSDESCLVETRDQIDKSQTLLFRVVSAGRQLLGIEKGGFRKPRWVEGILKVRLVLYPRAHPPEIARRKVRASRLSVLRRERLEFSQRDVIAYDPRRECQPDRNAKKEETRYDVPLTFPCKLYQEEKNDRDQQENRIRPRQYREAARETRAEPVPQTIARSQHAEHDRKSHEEQR